jgi:hypothetical protein
VEAHAACGPLIGGARVPLAEWQLARRDDPTAPFATSIRQAIARGLVADCRKFFLSRRARADDHDGLGNFGTAGMLSAILVIIVVGVGLMDLGHLEPVCGVAGQER